ncbi:MAG: hydrogenase/urease maturation nickel metallochaperone HypA [Nitrospinales bacterium]
MHEQSLMADLMRKIEAICKEQGSKNVIGIKVKIGALAHISADHFKEHFVQASKGSGVENVKLHIEELKNINDPHAQEIILDSIEVEE